MITELLKYCDDVLSIMWIHDRVSAAIKAHEESGGIPKTVILGERVYIALLKYNRVATGSFHHSDLNGIMGLDICVIPNRSTTIRVSSDSKEVVMRTIVYM